LNTDLIYSCAHFVIEIGEKYSHNGGFSYNLMTISHIVAYFSMTSCSLHKTSCTVLVDRVKHHGRHQDFWGRGQRGGKAEGKRKLLLSDF